MLYFPSRQRLLIAALGVAFGATMVSGPAPAWAQTGVAAQAFDIRIAAQPLVGALNDLSKQTGIQVMAATEATEGVQAPAVSGRLTAEQALKALLANGPLRAVRSGDGSFIIERTPAQATSTLPPVTVTASVAKQESATGRIQGLAAKRSATATKTDTPLIETPQSISIVGAKDVETIKAQSLMDALGYVAGVARVEGADRTTESLMLRGFQAWADNGSLYRDGTRYGVNVNNGTQEPYGLERIEVLKGASSVLYGAAAPGGIINTVSKRPTADTLREINVEVGSFNRKQVSGDFGGAIDDPAVWTYRFTFLARDSDTFVDHVPDDRLYIAPALKWQPSAATSLTLLAEFQKDLTAYVSGLPADGTVNPNPNGQVPIHRFIGEPGFDKYDNQRGSMGYLLEHAFSEQVKLRQNVRLYKQANARLFAYTPYPIGTLAGQRAIARGLARVEDDSTAATVDTSVEYQWRSGTVAHTLLGGLDYSYQKHQQINNLGTLADLDLFTPTYGAPLGTLTYRGTRQFRDRKLGVYAQDQMKIADQWVVLLGGRQEWSKNDTRSADVPQPPWANEDSDAFTGRTGLVYLAGNGLAPFVSYSQSFEPTAGIDAITGERLRPTRGDQYEVGMRFQPDNGDLMLSATAYQLTKVNAVVYDSGFNPRQLGMARSRGFEFEARARVTRQTNLVAAYTYTDARSKDPLVSNDTKRMAGVPFNQFSLWLDHDLRGLELPGFKVGAGLRYVGDTTASDTPGAVAPSFTLVDAMVSYATGPWRLALNATNLADKRYVASCTFGCFYGEPRKVIGTVSYRW
ncbi:MAG: TonB-dependent siderophore receptor [Rubrivivax sp.]|nr:MAG: TonB-dependent siderophore receptor [Rubrivivax sp.]